MLEWAAFAEALHLGVDDAGVQFAHHVIAEPEPLDRAGGKILHADVGLAEHVLHQGKPARRFQVERDGLLVRVEHVEVIRIIVRLSRPQPAPRIAHLRVFDLHHFRTKPGERLGAGGTCFELREVHDADSREKINLGAVFLHGSRFLQGVARYDRALGWKLPQASPIAKLDGAPLVMPSAVSVDSPRCCYAVMAGLVPAIRSGTLPRRMAGTSPAMTEGRVAMEGYWFLSPAAAGQVSV